MRSHVMAEFKTTEQLIEATQQVRAQSYTDFDTYTPYPVHGLPEAMGLKRSPVPLIALIGGVCGASGAYLMQWYCAAISFPINVGNRLLNSAPAFIPITFEGGILISVLSIFFGVLGLAGMPRLHHPVFELEAFRSASTHAFWLSVAVDSPEKNAALTEQLTQLGASHVATVEEAP